MANRTDNAERWTRKQILDNLDRESGVSLGTRFAAGAFDDPAEKRAAIIKEYGELLPGEKLHPALAGNYVVKNPDFDADDPASKRFLLFDPPGLAGDVLGELGDWGRTAAEAVGGTVGGAVGAYSGSIAGPVGTVGGATLGGAEGTQIAGRGYEMLADQLLGGDVMEESWDEVKDEAGSEMIGEMMLTGPMSSMRPLVQGLRGRGIRAGISEERPEGFWNSILYGTGLRKVPPSARVIEGQQAVKDAEALGIEMPPLMDLVTPAVKNSFETSDMLLALENKLKRAGNPKAAEILAKQRRKATRSMQQKGQQMSDELGEAKREVDAGTGTRDVDADMAAVDEFRGFQEHFMDEAGDFNIDKLMEYAGTKTTADEFKTAFPKTGEDLHKIAKMWNKMSNAKGARRSTEFPGMDFGQFAKTAIFLAFRPHLAAGRAAKGTLSSKSQAKLLAEPAFTKWLLSLGDMPMPGQKTWKGKTIRPASESLTRLATIAADNPEIGDAVGGFISGMASLITPNVQAAEMNPDMTFEDLQGAFEGMSDADANRWLWNTTPEQEAALAEVENMRYQ